MIIFQFLDNFYNLDPVPGGNLNTDPYGSGSTTLLISRYWYSIVAGSGYKTNNSGSRVKLGSNRNQIRNSDPNINFLIFYLNFSTGTR